MPAGPEKTPTDSLEAAVERAEDIDEAATELAASGPASRQAIEDFGRRLKENSDHLAEYIFRRAREAKS